MNHDDQINEDGRAFNGNWWAVLVAFGAIALFSLVAIGKLMGLG